MRMKLFFTVIIALQAAHLWSLDTTNAVISGRVLSPSNNPYAAEVRVIQFVIHNGFRLTRTRCVVNTDAQGSFDCRGLSEGQTLACRTLSMDRVSRIWEKPT